MIIRRGNIVQLITKAGVQGYISAEDLKQIADQKEFHRFWLKEFSSLV